VFSGRKAGRGLAFFRIAPFENPLEKKLPGSIRTLPGKV
jgi:hypothetical protein